MSERPAADPQRLRALTEAAVALASERDAEALLQRIVEVARDLLACRYAALAIWGEGERIERFLFAGVGKQEAARIGHPPAGRGILGAVMREARPIRLPDIAADPRAAGLPPGHPPLRSFLGVPIRSRGGTLGDLYMAEKSGAPEFSEEDELLATSLAALAGVAAETASLFEREQAAVRHLRELDAIRADFVSMVSHEFRTPLAAIRGFTSLLRDRDALPLGERRTIAGSIISQCDTLADLVEDVLDVSRIEAGTFSFAFHVYEPLRMIEEAAAATSASHPEHEIGIDAPEPLPPLRGDRDRMAQVLRNLLTNACRYSPPGSPVTVRAAADADGLRIAVEDRGIGIAAENLPRLFRRFGRLRTPDTRRVQGTGLGLYISKHIAEAHGGRIEVESRPREGSTFTVCVPRDPHQTRAGRIPRGSRDR